MGKCSGLKGGGHQRKAIDLADNKKKEKKARKKKQEEAGQRAMVMQEILNSPHADCDIYLMAKDDDKCGELCRSYFRYDDCSNRRCKLSHKYTIAEALNTTIIHNNNDDDDDDAATAPSIPALEFFPGISGGMIKRRRRIWKTPSSSSSQKEEEDIGTSDSSEIVITLEHALLEGSPVVNTIVSYLESDQDVIHLALSCRHLYQLVENCQDVQRRKHQFQQSQLYRRNQELLSSKAIAGRLQYVITYQNLELLTPQKDGSNNKNKKKNKHKSKKKNHNSQQPVLIYDCENPHVFKAFQEAMLRKQLSTTTLHE